MRSPVLLSLMGTLHVSRADSALSTQHSPSLLGLHERLGGLKGLVQSMHAAPAPGVACVESHLEQIVSMCVHQNLAPPIVMPVVHCLLTPDAVIQAVSTSLELASWAAFRSSRTHLFQQQQLLPTP